VIEDATDRLAAIGVQGAQARAVWRSAGIAVPELEPLQLASLTWRGVEITLVRAEAWKGEAYEICWRRRAWLLGPKRCNYSGAVPVGAGGAAAFTGWQRGFVVGEDIRERDLPQKLGRSELYTLQRAAMWARDCGAYPLRGQVHRVFSGFEVSAPCAPGDKIEAEARKWARLRVRRISPGQKKPADWAGYLRREAFGKVLTVHGAAANA